MNLCTSRAHGALDDTLAVTRLMGWLRRGLGASLVATLGAGLLVGLQASPASAAVSLSGARMWAPNTSYTGSADTAEKINAIVKSGDVLYVGGSFSQLRPEPGAGVPSLAQANLYAVDTRTGAYLPAFRPVVNGIVEALEVDAATGTLFVGGRFTQVNGQANAGFAILDAATGQLKAGITQRPVNKGGSTPGVVMGLKRVGRQLYVAGDFVNIGGAQRGNLARLDIDAGLTPDSFQAYIAGLVRAVDVDPANPGRIYIGGEFSGVRASSGGATLPGTRWLAALQTSGPSTGLPDATFIPNVPCDTDPMCTNPTRGRRVVARNGLVYVAFGGGSGRFGIYNQSTGLNLRMLRADGDVQTVALIGDRVYVGGHFTRIFGGETRCQLFSVLAASPWTVQADPNFDNGSHLGVFEVAGDAGGNVYAAGHLVSPNTTASPACNLGIQHRDLQPHRPALAQPCERHHRAERPRGQRLAVALHGGQRQLVAELGRQRGVDLLPLRERRAHRGALGGADVPCPRRPQPPHQLHRAGAGARPVRQPIGAVGPGLVRDRLGASGTAQPSAGLRPVLPDRRPGSHPRHPLGDRRHRGPPDGWRTRALPGARRRRRACHRCAVGGPQHDGGRADPERLRHDLPDRRGPPDRLEPQLRGGGDGAQPRAGAGRRRRHGRGLPERRIVASHRRRGGLVRLQCRDTAGRAHRTAVARACARHAAGDAWRPARSGRDGARPSRSRSCRPGRATRAWSST